ncbi:MAG TPA: carboxypeptidase-like regulatory domain-containing protein [Oscillatoriaceae cyanobacterium]
MPSRLPIAIASLTCLAACTVAPAPMPTATPTPSPSAASPSPSLSPSATPAIALPTKDIVGWVQQSNLEPSPGPVPICPNMQLAVSGNVLTLRQPDACGRPYATLTGTISGNEVQLKGTEGASEQAVSYELTYNPTTQHFVGTRNGVLVWFAPSNSACAAPDCLDTIDGQVYDTLQRPLLGATVQAVSENAFAPYTASTTTQDQGWYTLSVPAGVTLTITVTKDGWHTRYRSVVPLSLTTGRQNRLNFGGPDTTDDSQASNFGLEPIAPTP